MVYDDSNYMHKTIMKILHSKNSNITLNITLNNITHIALGFVAAFCCVL